MDKLSLRTAILANSLTLARLFAGLAFPFLSVRWRPVIVMAAAISDGIDGAISRRFHAATTAGRLLDPIADKVFVLMAVGTLWQEGTPPLWQIALIGLRDWSVLLIGAWLMATRSWNRFHDMAPSWLGKLTTAAQFIFLLHLLLALKMVPALLTITAVISGLASIGYLREACTSRSRLSV